MKDKLFGCAGFSVGNFNMDRPHYVKASTGRQRIDRMVLGRAFVSAFALCDYGVTCWRFAHPPSRDLASA